MSGARKRKIQQTNDECSHVLNQIDIDLPLVNVDAIFNPHHQWSAIEQPMRETFKTEYERMIHWKYPNPSQEFFQRYLKSDAKNKNVIEVPYDLDPSQFDGRILFIDYMNVYKHYRKELLSDASAISLEDIHARITFEDKISNLENKEFLIGLLYFAFKKFNWTAPNETDWIIIISQGDELDGKLNVEQIEFLNNCKCLRLQIPCFELTTMTACHRFYHKNEVDDYILLYFILYFQRYRQHVGQCIYDLNVCFQKETNQEKKDDIEILRSYLRDFLENQKIRLLSWDNYDWSNREFSLRIIKEPDWAPLFTIGRGDPRRGKNNRKRGSGRRRS